MKRLILLSLFAVASCQPKESATNIEEKHQPTDAETETCAACGMVMREQPAPRGQVIHRNGDRQFLCSIDDLLQYLNIPSPNGQPIRIYSEVMPDAHAVDDMDTDFQPWQEADQLFYVTGIKRKGVMGAPVLSYSTREAADKAAAKFGGSVVDFEQLRKQTNE